MSTDGSKTINKTNQENVMKAKKEVQKNDYSDEMELFSILDTAMRGYVIAHGTVQEGIKIVCGKKKQSKSGETIYVLTQADMNELVHVLLEGFKEVIEVAE